MDVRRQFPDVHYIWEGGSSVVYEVHPRIVVKISQTGEYEREQFQKELRIYEMFSRCPPCTYIIQCFFYTDNGIFLEYMRDACLYYRIQENHTRDDKTRIVTKADNLESPPLQKRWIDDLAQAIAFLESLNLAHGDLRPENILLDRDRLKLSDFDCTAEIGTDCEAYGTPNARLLNDSKNDEGDCGSFGFLGQR